MKHELLRLAGATTGAILAALVWVAGMEAWLRLSIPASSGESIYRYTLDTERYKVMKASASVLAWGEELRTNDLGFRDNAPTIPPKQPGEFRIIVLGSSFTVSAGVDFEDIYTTRLERQLRRKYPKAEVINLAVAGYNPLQQALVLQEVGLTLAPDLVLVALFPSGDFSTDIYEENRRLAMGEAPPAVPGGAWYEDSYVYRAYGSKLVAKAAGLMRRNSARSDPAKAQRGWDEGTAALQSIAATASKRGLPVAVAVLPHNFNFPSQRETFARVERFCHDADLFCVNLLESFIARRWREAELRLNPLDSHPNAKYHAVVADVLAGILGPMLPPPGGEPAQLMRARGD